MRSRDEMLAGGCMYARLRTASTKPSACLLCTFLSPSQIPHASSARRHTARAQAVPQLQKIRPTAQPGSSSSSISSTFSDLDDLPTVDVAVNSKGKKRNAVDNKSKSARQALKEAQETERRRKALATLDKTTKFVAAGLDDSHEPTLADLERFKPEEPPPITLDFVFPNPTLPSYIGSPTPSAVDRYRKAFQKHVSVLASKFRRKQLLRLYKEGMQTRPTTLPGTPRKKGSLKNSQDVAGEIVRWLWNWPYIKEVEERVSHMTSRAGREFLISPSEFFLLLGPDGSSLRALMESYGVTIKGVKRTNDAFTLEVEGLSYMLDQLNLDLAEHKKRIITELIRVTPSVNAASGPGSSDTSSVLPDLTQRISKLTNALVEDMGHSELRISAHHPQNIMTCKRLVMRTFQQNGLPTPALLAHLPTSQVSTLDHMASHTVSHNYALFPFELTNAERLPFHWISTSNPTRSSDTEPMDTLTSVSPVPHHFFGSPYVYRVRKVCDWFGQMRKGAMISSLGDGIDRLIDSTGQSQSLRKCLGLPDLDSPESDSRQQVIITARPGHFVIAPATRMKSLLPPLRGSWELSKVLEWMRVNAGRMAFIPELPNPLLNSSPTSQVVLSRLVYRSSTIPMNSPDEPQTGTVTSPLIFATLKFEVLSPQPVLRAEDPTEDLDPEGHFDATMRMLHEEQDNIAGSQSLLDEDVTITQPSQVSPTPSSEKPLESLLEPARLWEGVETIMNVMLPDRPMDLQLSTFDSTSISSESEPLELRDYASRLTHCLSHSDSYSRPIPPLHVTYEGTRYVLDIDATVQSSSHVVTDFSTTEPLDITIENMVDVESKHQSDSCYVTYVEKTASSWHKFLDACDRLTWLSPRRGSIHSTTHSKQDNTSIPNAVDTWH